MMTQGMPRSNCYHSTGRMKAAMVAMPTLSSLDQLWAES